MKIKTIQDKDLKLFEEKINAFGDVKNVKATQTHVNGTEENNSLIYTAVLYYEE